MSNKGMLIILSGPSGVGKSTLRKRLIDRNDNFWYSISMTTREPRKRDKDNNLEEHGKDYFFVSQEEFEKNIKNNNFLEYAEVYKNTYYGTPKDIVFEKINKGYDVILEIDVEGALNVKKQYKDAILIFIAPPSMEELERRLIDRKREPEEKIKERIAKAKTELGYLEEYDYVIISGSKEEDYLKIKTIIDKEKISKL